MRSLPPIQRAAERGELSKEAVALLTDRTLLVLGKEQTGGPPLGVGSFRLYPLGKTVLITDC